MDFRIHDRTLRIAPRTRAGLLADLSDRLRSRRGFALATINLDHLVKLPRDRQFLDAYARHDFVVADGNPVVWLSRLIRPRNTTSVSIIGWTTRKFSQTME